MKNGSFFKKFSNLWPLVFLIVVISIFTGIKPVFISLRSIQNSLMAATLIAIVGAGETFIIISGGIDLSAAYVMGLNGVVAALIIRSMDMAGYTPLLSIPIGIICGLLFSLIPGFINGLMIAKLKVPPFIATIGIMSVAEGAVYLANDGLPVVALPKLIGEIGNYHIFYLIPNKGWTITRPEGFGSMRDLVQIMPIPVLMMIFIIALLYFILHKTLYGRYIFAIGSNITASRFSGVPVDKVLIKTYMLGSLLYGIAGIIYTLRFSVAAPQMGEPMLLNAIGAVFIGGAAMTGGVGTIIGTVIGALIIAVLQTGLSTIGLASFWQYITVGLVIIFAVLFDRLKVRLIEQ